MSLQNLLTSTLCVGSVENKRIDETFESIEGVFTGIDDQTWNTTSQHSGFGEVTPSTSLAAVEAESLYEVLREKAEEGRFKMNIGSTDMTSEKHVETVTDDDSTVGSEDGEDEATMFEFVKDDWEFDEDDLDEFMAAAAMAGKPGGVTPEHLSKIWRISVPEAKHTIETTLQHFI